MSDMIKTTGVPLEETKKSMLGGINGSLELPRRDGHITRLCLRGDLPQVLLKICSGAVEPQLLQQSASTVGGANHRSDSAVVHSTHV